MKGQTWTFDERPARKNFSRLVWDWAQGKYGRPPLKMIYNQFVGTILEFEDGETVELNPKELDKLAVEVGWKESKEKPAPRVVAIRREQIKPPKIEEKPAPVPATPKEVSKQYRLIEYCGQCADCSKSPGHRIDGTNEFLPDKLYCLMTGEDVSMGFSDNCPLDSPDCELDRLRSKIDEFGQARITFKPPEESERIKKLKSALDVFARIGRMPEDMRWRHIKTRIGAEAYVNAARIFDDDERNN